MTGSELEELRAEMLEVLADPRVENIWDGLAATLGHEAAGRSAADLRKAFFYGLTNARIHSISAEGAKFAEAQALAADPVDLRVEDLPCPHGLVVFDEPVTAYRVADEGREVRLPMTGLLWTEVSSAAGVRGVAIYALSAEFRMPAFASVIAYGRRTAGKAAEQSVFFKVAQVCWWMLAGSSPSTGEIETRRANLPDGKEVVIAVRPGLSQDEVDLLAARIWQELPE